MATYSELRKKFPRKKTAPKASVTREAVRDIRKEYERKRAELGLDGRKFVRTPTYYICIVLFMTFLALLFIGKMQGVLTFGKKRISKADIQARQSIDALAQALGRYKFHVGAYPTEGDGLEELARIRSGLKGWNGPYVKKVVSDPWGRDYVYGVREGGGHPVLYSKGPDGRAGTLDDVLPEQAAFDAPFRDTTWTNEWMPYQLRGIVVAPNEEARRKIQEEVRKVKGE